MSQERQIGTDPKTVVALPANAPPVWALLAAYNVALEVCEERNPRSAGYIVTPEGFHEWLLKRQDLRYAKVKERREKAAKLAKAKTKRTTVAEAKQALATTAGDGDTFVWGTRHGEVGSGTRAEFQAFLSSASDGDILVWGN